MPYRALTHNRVKSFLTAENATTQSQASAINSQNGVANSGSVTSVRNQLNISNNNPPPTWSKVTCSNGGCAFLMGANAYGPGTQTLAGNVFSTYAPGQGKGFPSATPQTSVGSTNTFARRAIARRAVTTLQNTGVKKDCACVPQPVKNLKGQFHK